MSDSDDDKKMPGVDVVAAEGDQKMPVVDGAAVETRGMMAPATDDEDMESEPEANPMESAKAVFEEEEEEEEDSKPGAIPTDNEYVEEEEEMDTKPTSIPTGAEIEAEADEAAEDDYVLEQQTEEVHIEQNQDGVMGVPAANTYFELHPEEEMDSKPAARATGTENEAEGGAEFLPSAMVNKANEAAGDDYVREQQTENVHIGQNQDGVIGVPAVNTDLELQPEILEENDAVEEFPMMMEQPAPIVYDAAMDAGMMAPITEDEETHAVKNIFEEGDAKIPAQPTLKDPPPPSGVDNAVGVDAANSSGTPVPPVTEPGQVTPEAADEEAGQPADNSQQPGAVSSTEVPLGANDKETPKAAEGPNTADQNSKKTTEQGEGEGKPKKSEREINPNFRDVQSTGKWGTISKMEMIIVGVVSVLIVIGVIVAVILVVGRDEDPVVDVVPAATQAPTPMATPIPAAERFPFLIDALGSNNATMSLVEGRYSGDPADYEGLVGPGGECSSLPHVCAMSWVLYEDTFPPASNDIVDRFAMAALYYSLGGRSWKNNSNWLSPESYCEWYGIKCNRKETDIEEIDLVDNNLVGEIPLELGLADTVHAVSLKVNAISGGLPGAVFGGMPQLYVLYIQDNQLTGTIPNNLRGNNSLGMYYSLRLLRLDYVLY